MTDIKNVSKSILDFGAKGDGVSDDFFAFQKALDSGTCVITVPHGTYLISQTLKVNSNTEIIADRNAKIVMKSLVRRKRQEFLLSNADTEGGNENIKITGGVWDGNNTAFENAKPDLFDKTGYSGAMLNFVNVKGLELRDMVLANSVTFYVRMSKVHNFVIENIDFTCDYFGRNQDGLHFGGDVKHGKVKNIRALSFGQTNDDMIALNADDSIERVENLDLCRDTIEDLTIEDIYAENCHTIIRILSVTAMIKDIRFKNVYGGFRCNAINADAARYCATPLFDENNYPQGVGRISNLSFENFTCYPVFSLPEGFGGTKNKPETALMFEAHMDNVKFSNFNYICDESHIGACPVLSAKNLCGEKFCADNKEYIATKKGDVVVIKNFKELSIDKILSE